jgi:hypothetical protein
MTLLLDRFCSSLLMNPACGLRREPWGTPASNQVA